MPEATIDLAAATLSSCTGAVIRAPASSRVLQSLIRSRHVGEGEPLGELDAIEGLGEGLDDKVGGCADGDGPAC
jgi:hypothetical protein